MSEAEIDAIDTLREEIEDRKHQISVLEKQRTDRLSAKTPVVYKLRVKYAGHGGYGGFTHTLGNYSTLELAEKAKPATFVRGPHHSPGSAYVTPVVSTTLSLDELDNLDNPASQYFFDD
jgi:hypothetical protein